MYHHFATLFLAVLAFISRLGVLAQTSTTLSYDNNYDDSSLSMNNVACSTGPNGLAQKYPTLGSLPNFPNVGGAYTVQYGSDQCGSCYAVTYGDTTVNILAVDGSKTGFTTSEAAMNTLTGGLAEDLGRVDVTYTVVNASECGL